MPGGFSGREPTPFAMSYENLKLRALTARDYLIKCQTMAMFASIRELQLLINNLNIRTHLFANTVSNFTPVTAYLPYDREKATNERKGQISRPTIN